MTTMEHLFMHIFERRSWIEGQLRQQAESCAHSLASNLLAHGRRPPPWLWAQPGPQDLNREELISGILFPVPRATTPSGKQSSLFTMPAAKADIFPSNSYITDTRTSDKYITNDNRVQAGPSNHPKTSEQGSDNMARGEAVEVHAELDPLARIQRSRSRQRDLENRLRKKAKIVEDSSEDNIILGFTGRVTRSMTSSLKPDCVKELLEPTNGRITRSRYGAQKPDCVNLQKMVCIGNGIQEEAKAQTFAAGANVLVSDAAAPAFHECSKKSANASRLSEANFLVQPKQLFYDGMQCSLNVTSVVVEASNEELAWIGSKEAPHFIRSIHVEEGGDQHAVETTYCTEEADKIQETLVVEDSECSSDPSPLYHRTTPLECNSRPSVCDDKPLNLCYPSSRKPKHCVSESSLGRSMLDVREECCSGKHFEALTGSMASRPPENNLIVDPKHPFASSETCDYNNSNFLKESHGKSPGVSSRKCKTSQSVNEGTMNKASRISASRHLQKESTLNSSGTLHRVDEVERVSGGLVEERLQLLEVEDPECCSHSVSYKGHVTDPLDMNGKSSLGGQVQHKHEESHGEELVKASGNVGSPPEVGYLVEPTPFCSDGIEECGLIAKFPSDLEQKINGSQSKVVLAMFEAGQLVKEDPIRRDSERTHVSSANSMKVRISSEEPNSVLSDVQEEEIPRSLVTESPHMLAMLSQNEVVLEPVAQVQNAKLEVRHLGRSDIEEKYKSNRSYSSVLPSSASGGAHEESEEAIVYAHRSDAVDECVNGQISNKEAVEIRYFLRSSRSLDKNLCRQQSSSVLSRFNEDCTLLDDHKNYLIVGNVAEIGVVQQEVTPYGTETHNVLNGSRYFLRSSTRHVNDSASFKSHGTNGAGKLELSKETTDHACEITWPKRRKIVGRSRNILATTPRLKAKALLHVQQGNDYTYKKVKKNASGAVKGLQPSPQSNQVAIGISRAAMERHSEEIHQSKKRRITEGDGYLKGKDPDLMIRMPMEHTHDTAFPDQQCGESENYLLNEVGDIESKLLSLENQHCSEEKEEEKEDVFCDGNTLECETHKKQGYNEDVTSQRVICDRVESLGRHDSVQWLEHDDDLAACDDTVPEFEGFSIGFPSLLEDGIIFNDSNIPNLTKERASLLEQLCRSRGMLTPVSHSSTKYKIHNVPDVYQSLPAGLLEHISTSSSLQFNDVVMNKNGAEEDVNFASSCSKFQSDFDGLSLERPHSHSMPCSHFRSTCEVKKPPLTPPFGKLNQRISTRKSASSEKMSSNPELICFRIDENSSTTEEHGHYDKCEATSEEKVGLMETNVSTDRKPLVDVTSIYQNAPALACAPEKFVERSSLDSVNTDSRTLIDINLGMEKGYDNNGQCKPDGKENITFSATGNRLRKAADSLSSRSSKPGVSGKGRERNGSRIFSGKGGKPNNIISNISSFIPLVRQKQQATAPLAGKRDIKVKALEAAEAAKRLEEKKQNERELRKAAAKFERERLEKENARQLELKQKQQEEIKRKKEADVAARKRRREDEERKEKERKRRCIDESRKQHRVYGERLCVEKEAKDPSHKAADDKEQRRNDFLEDGKRQSKSERGRETTDSKKVTEVKLGDGRLGGSSLEVHDVFKQSNVIEKVEKNSAQLQTTIQDRMSFTKGCKDMESYGISPYKDSDDEDAEDDNIRKRKYIPQWARRDSLDQRLLSMRHLDPSVIFSRKSSFNLSEVLSPRFFRRPL